MDKYPVLSTLLEAIDIPCESLSIRCVHTLDQSGMEGSSAACLSAHSPGFHESNAHKLLD